MVDFTVTTKTIRRCLHVGESNNVCGLAERSFVVP